MNREIIDRAIEQSIQYLSSDNELVGVGGGRSRRKWDGAWWHMAALYEIGEARQIPEAAVAKALGLLKNSTWPRFVITREDSPIQEADKAKMDCCHCELAVYYMVLAASGCDVDGEIPWIRRWLMKHQLPDGGLNCEPSAYLNSRKSSLVSTLPPLEAILLHTNREFTPEEASFVDEGARFLIEHRLVCSKQDGSLLNTEWLKPCFPRFFEYDILRGMHYLAQWSRIRNKPLPVQVLKEGLDRLGGYIGEEGVRIGRQVFDRNGPWGGKTFDLLEAIAVIGTEPPWLKAQLNAVVTELEADVLHGIQIASDSEAR
ncbi:hypothetical protein [Paenibacillus hemerocallicola]|uniref:hypothetical protein n=1 Tax=Paenibacillus hemerocallicola TaxID=1172614 RepID=UPI001FEB6A17|nr:hypothetical protein [Paenibacillus hemerocallicola]